MAQTAMTVRIDSEQKAMFDNLCEQFGMSANAAINVFVKAVIRTRSIPFAIKAKADKPEDEATFPHDSKSCDSGTNDGDIGL